VEKVADALDKATPASQQSAKSPTTPFFLALSQTSAFSHVEPTTIDASAAAARGQGISD